MELGENSNRGSSRPPRPPLPAPYSPPTLAQSSPLEIVESVEESKNGDEDKSDAGKLKTFVKAYFSLVIKQI